MEVYGIRNRLFKKKNPRDVVSRALSEINLAATYSRASYTSTTIGPATFHGRVRNGNVWFHRGNATRKIKTTINVVAVKNDSLTIAYRRGLST
jgi:hypothetical protein